MLRSSTHLTLQHGLVVSMGWWSAGGWQAVVLSSAARCLLELAGNPLLTWHGQVERRALNEKNKGNEHYKAGDFKEALRCTRIRMPSHAADQVYLCVDHLSYRACISEVRSRNALAACVCA